MTPKVPHLTDLFGEEFEKAYIEAEEAELYERQVDAQDLYLKMMRTLAETGNGWMTFKDSSNQNAIKPLIRNLRTITTVALV